MKNAKHYEGKIRKLLKGSSAPEASPPEESPLRLMVRGVLLADADESQAQQAMAGLDAEFVDYNELRVAPLKEIVEAIGRSYPGAADKAEILHLSLNRLFDQSCTMSADYMRDMSKRDLRRHLTELGLSHFATAYLLLMGFDAHAIPVDESLLDALEIEECIHPGSDVADVQGFLERVIVQKDARKAHAALRACVSSHQDVVTEKRIARETDRQARHQRRIDEFDLSRRGPARLPLPEVDDLDDVPDEEPPAEGAPAKTPRPKSRKASAAKGKSVSRKKTRGA